MTAAEMSAPYLRADLERQLVSAMIKLSTAVDSRGLRIMLTCAPTTYRLGQRLRELAAMTEREFITEGVSQEHALATLARNCLLVAQAFDAAAALEEHMALYPGVGVVPWVEGDGVVFGRAKTHD